MLVTIRTRYASRPGSNVGTYRATGAGRTFTAPPRQDVNANTAEEIAARALTLILAGAPAANARNWARIVTPAALAGFGPLEPVGKSNGVTVWSVNA